MLIRHSVQFVHVFAQFIKDRPFPISQNVYQVREESSKEESFQNDVIFLSAGDILRVVVQTSGGSITLGRENSFGVMAL